ncbi:MAG: tRNA (cytidine(34)-2'-O)-methyltransferase [Silvanigrellales bacterium]|nr:tRNA (cytidine(34)-2'-O)-methyltransferase [Silvanigrellales bacterium]
MAPRSTVLPETLPPAQAETLSKAPSQVLSQVPSQARSHVVARVERVVASSPENLTPPNVVFREGWRVSDEDAKKLRDFHPEVVLVAPQIPPNTGTVARLCGALCTKLHLVEPLGFDVSEKAVRRAGLDYWDEVDITVHGSLAALRAFKPGRRLVLVETGGTVSPSSFAFEPGDLLVFGSETQGLPTDVLRESESNPNVVILTVPMYSSRVRSLNLANTVSMVVFAAVENLRERFLKNRTGQSDCEGAGCPS